jgi:hypothetical protein
MHSFKGSVKKLSRYTPWRHMGGEEVYLLVILNLGTRWGWVVSVTPRPRCTPGERTPGIHWIGGWVGPRAGLDAEAWKKIIWACRGPNPDRPARSQTLYFKGSVFRLIKSVNKYKFLTVATLLHISYKYFRFFKYFSVHIWVPCRLSLCRVDIIIGGRESKVMHWCRNYIKFSGYLLRPLCFLWNPTWHWLSCWFVVGLLTFSNEWTNIRALYLGFTWCSFDLCSVLWPYVVVDAFSNINVLSASLRHMATVRLINNCRLHPSPVMIASVSHLQLLLETIFVCFVFNCLK